MNDSTTSLGRKAEELVAKYFKKHKYNIVAQNWRNRLCEIDIIATKNGTVYFIEVKYRQNNHFGDGLDAITGAKLNQMQFAADNWVTKNAWTGQMQLVAVSVTGNPLQIVDIIEIE